jgi:hypothetical protein
MLDNIGRFMEWVGSSHKTVVDELLSSLGLFTRFISFLGYNRMETSSSSCFVIMKCRIYSKVVMQD